jgi:hypothetical protein
VGDWSFIAGARALIYGHGRQRPDCGRFAEELTRHHLVIHLVQSSKVPRAAAGWRNGHEPADELLTQDARQRPDRGAGQKIQRHTNVQNC